MKLPVEVPVLALALQYLAQFTHSGIRSSYIGAYLSVPVALLTLRWLAGGSRRPDAPSLTASAAAIAVGAWIAVGSALLIYTNPYFEFSRSQLTATFHSDKLAGITSHPQTVSRIDAAVSAIDRYSSPGDHIFVFPDLAGLYYITGRENSTRQDWYYPFVVDEPILQQALLDLARNPPKVVLLQTYAEADFARTSPIDYQSYPALRGIYRYLRLHYASVARAGDIEVLVPR
jgi:hypothetical protein